MIVSPNDAKAYDKVLKLTKKEPEAVVLDLDWSLAAGGDSERRGGRSGSRSAPRRSERSDRAPRGPRGKDDPGNRAPEDAASMEPFRPAVVESAPEESVSRPTRTRSRAPARSSAPEPVMAEVAAPAPRPEHRRADADRTRPVRGVREAAPRDLDDTHGVVGFGSDVPAFLTRATPLPAPSKKSAASADND
jgi:hypothetical protein